MKLYLEKVGEIRSSMPIPPSKSQKRKFLDKLPQDSRRHYKSSIDSLVRAVEERQNTEDWYIINDEMDSQNFITLKSKHPYGVAVYMIAFQNPEGVTEVGFSMRKPKPIQWIEQAKSRVEEEENNKNPTKDNEEKFEDDRSLNSFGKAEIEHNHKIDKNKNKIESKEKSKNQSDSSNESPSRIESDIEKENLIILLSARISNVLHATRKREDFREIVDYYDELESVLKDIYDMESLIENKDRLPYEINSEDIENIKSQSVIIENNSSNNNNSYGGDDKDKSRNQDFSAFEMN